MIAVNLERRLAGVPHDNDAATVRAIDAIYNEALETATKVLGTKHVIGVITFAADTRPTGEVAPNGLPVLSGSVPWRVTRLYDVWDTEGRVNGSRWLRAWQDAFHRNFTHALTTWRSPPPREAVGA